MSSSMKAGAGGEETKTVRNMASEFAVVLPEVVFDELP
jgi:hypothetical protein